MTKYGRNRNVYLPADDEAKLDKLASMLRAEGVDIENEKNPDTVSISKMIRWLVDRELERRGQADTNP